METLHRNWDNTPFSNNIKNVKVNIKKWKFRSIYYILEHII